MRSIASTQLVARDRLRDVAARAGADHADHVLGRVRDRQREELHAGPLERDARDHGLAAAVGQVHVEQHDLGIELADQRDRLGHAAGLADDVDDALQLAAHAGAEERVVVDQHDAAHHDLLGIVSSISVPSPGADLIVARPPARASRPSIDSRSPRRSAGTAARSKPAPRSRTKTETRRRVRLGVHRDLAAARELGGVRHRLARGEHELLDVGVERHVARPTRARS